MPEPAYTRLDVDERRRRLLELGRQLFATHSYGELSMADIARAAGISKALLYHYFPSKQEYFQATLATAAIHHLVRAYFTMETSRSARESAASRNPRAV